MHFLAKPYHTSELLHKSYWSFNGPAVSHQAGVAQIVRMWFDSRLQPASGRCTCIIRSNKSWNTMALAVIGMQGAFRSCQLILGMCSRNPRDCHAGVLREYRACRGCPADL